MYLLSLVLFECKGGEKGREGREGTLFNAVYTCLTIEDKIGSYVQWENCQEKILFLPFRLVFLFPHSTEKIVSLQIQFRKRGFSPFPPQKNHCLFKIPVLFFPRRPVPLPADAGPRRRLLPDAKHSARRLRPVL